jgi:hypothetical protein
VSAPSRDLVLASLEDGVNLATRPRLSPE